MNFIKLTSLKRARIILLINALILFVFIIFTPYFVKVGFLGISEWMIEGFFLAVEISVLIKLFRSYDQQSKQVEKEISDLDNKFKEQQKTLVDSLEYLGKMNVQMSVVKKVMSKLKFPADIDRFEYILNELVKSLITISGERGVVIRIIDLDNKKTVKKVEMISSQDGKNINSLSNEELCEQVDSKRNIRKDILIISSNYDNFSLRTLAIFPVKLEAPNEIDTEKKELIQGIVNQCEIIYLVFNSKYYKK